MGRADSFILSGAAMPSVCYLTLLYTYLYACEPRWNDVRNKQISDGSRGPIGAMGNNDYVSTPPAGRMQASSGAPPTPAVVATALLLCPYAHTCGRSERPRRGPVGGGDEPAVMVGGVQENEGRRESPRRANYTYSASRATWVGVVVVLLHHEASPRPPQDRRRCRRGRRPDGWC